MKVLIALPTYNEAQSLGAIVSSVLARVPEASILVVDDSSPDGTGEIADKLAEEDSRVFALHRPAKAGLGSAYRDAFRWALQRDFDSVVEMDADFSHDPEALPELIAACDGSNLVIGSRYVNGGKVQNWSKARLLLSRGGNLYAAVALGLPIRDATAGFRVYSRSILERIDLDSVRTNGYAFQIEMAYKAFLLGADIVEVPITFTDRRVGESKMSGKIVAEALAWVTAEAIKRRLRRR
ncbi:MAG: dolichol-phosphate mannosyltransferase [Acidimicrobiia bacterium]